MSILQKLVQSLQAIKTVDYSLPAQARQSNAKAERVLNLIFEIGVEQLGFTLDDKKIIGTLMVDAVKPIQINIERVGCIYRTRLDTSVLKKRSALQFMVDHYSRFPVGAETLSKEFNRANLSETISILDDIIQKWANESDSDEPTTDYETTGIPTTHTWWF